MTTAELAKMMAGELIGYSIAEIGNDGDNILIKLRNPLGGERICSIAATLTIETQTQREAKVQAVIRVGFGTPQPAVPSG